MIRELLGEKIAIVGAGKFCVTLLEFLFRDFPDHSPNIIGIADINDQAPGMQFAKSRGIFTTNDFTEFFRMKEIQLILELTRDPMLAEVIRKNKPPSVQLIDHYETRGLWDSIHIEEIRRESLREIEQKLDDPEAILDIFLRATDRYSQIIRRRNVRSREIEMELVEHERTQSQIIQGSTIPTFVINRNHRVTHWNKAIERLTGTKADQVVGTNRQWTAFYANERPTLADVILDQSEKDEIEKYYGTEWRKSAIIDDGYEVEAFFPSLGGEPRWCWFTAAPIKSPDGTIIGAIETLWDKTEDKKAEEERARHTHELSTLCSIYNAMSAHLGIDERINAAIREIRDFLSADTVCLYLSEQDNKFYLKYEDYGNSPFCSKSLVVEKSSIIYQAAQNNKNMVFEDLEQSDNEELQRHIELGFHSLAYIPVSVKERKALGVLRIGCLKSRRFSAEDRNILDLIANRIGLAIENARLQEKYIKSEEKYRILFNNDPNPIFIIDTKNLTILDINQRAEDCYDFDQDELIGLPFLCIGDEDDQEIVDGLKQISHDQSILFTKKRHYRKGHSPFYVNINISQTRYGDQDVIIATTTDITETIEKETQLIQAGKMTTLGVMAAGMAHEINQPLNVIQICADVLRKMLNKGQTISDEDIRSITNDIIANVDRATRVIKHVRSFARQSDITRTKININDPINDVFKIFGHQIKTHQIDLEIDLVPNPPMIMGDHNRLEQVFVNLVSNAIDAMDEKASLPKVRDPSKRLMIKSFVKDGHVAVTVKDTGIGMTDEIKKKIFEPFFTTKSVGKGTGLGTSISYGIVKDYDGIIDVESQYGKGTTFTVIFPAVS